MAFINKRATRHNSETDGTVEPDAARKETETTETNSQSENLNTSESANTTREPNTNTQTEAQADFETLGIDDVTPIVSEPSGLICPECNRSFNSERGMRRHYTTTHKSGSAARSNVIALPAKIKTNDLSQAANMFILGFQLLAVTMIGEHAEFTDAERKQIEPPLQRILARLPASAANKIGAYADPALLMLGLGMWSMRVFSYKKPKPNIAPDLSNTEKLQQTPEPVSPLHNAPGTSPNGLPVDSVGAEQWN